MSGKLSILHTRDIITIMKMESMERAGIDLPTWHAAEKELKYDQRILKFSLIELNSIIVPPMCFNSISAGSAGLILPWSPYPRYLLIIHVINEKNIKTFNFFSFCHVVSSQKLSFKELSYLGNLKVCKIVSG